MDARGGKVVCVCVCGGTLCNVHININRSIKHIHAYPVIRFKQAQYWKVVFLLVCSFVFIYAIKLAIFNLLESIAHEQRKDRQQCAAP